VEVEEVAVAAHDVDAIDVEVLTELREVRLRLERLEARMSGRQA
jgi:hypothetical protein